MEARQQFAEPQAYFIRDERETKKLEQEAAELRTLIEDAGTDWRTRENAASRLGEIERVLRASEFGKRPDKREAEPAVHQQQAAPPSKAAPEPPMYALPVPYHLVGNAGKVRWPDNFADRWALVQAAAEELRAANARAELRRQQRRRA